MRLENKPVEENQGAIDKSTRRTLAQSLLSTPSSIAITGVAKRVSHYTFQERTVSDQVEQVNVPMTDLV